MSKSILLMMKSVHSAARKTAKFDTKTIMILIQHYDYSIIEKTTNKARFILLDIELNCYNGESKPIISKKNSTMKGFSYRLFRPSWLLGNKAAMMV